MPSARDIYYQHAPADLKKDAGSFDLPIAIGMLIGTGQLAPDDMNDIAIVGELALDGNMRPVKGALAMALACKQQGLKRLIVPSANAREASVVEDVQVYGVSGLAEAMSFLAEIGRAHV